VNKCWLSCRVRYNRVWLLETNVIWTRVSANFNWSIHGFLYHKLKADQNLLCIAMSIIRQVPRRSNLWALRNPSGHWNIRSVWVLGSQHHNSSDKAWPRTLGSARILRYIFFENNFWGFLKIKMDAVCQVDFTLKNGQPPTARIGPQVNALGWTEQGSNWNLLLVQF